MKTINTITIYTFRKTGAPFTLVKTDETEGKAVIKDEEGKLHIVSMNTLKKNYKKSEQTIEVETEDKPKELNRHQQLAAKKVKAAYNWIVGGLENSVQDGNLDNMPPIENMFEQVYDGLMSEDYGDGYGGGNSKTELRFAGKQFILNTIADMFRRDGYDVPGELTQIKKNNKQHNGERKNIHGDIYVMKDNEVLLMAFTGMIIGAFPVVESNSKTVVVKTNKGNLKFDAKTGIQIDANNPKFANRIDV